MYHRAMLQRLVFFLLLACLANIPLLAGSSTIVIYALYHDTCLSDESEEAFAITNVSYSPIVINGWQVTDGTHTVSFVSER